MRNIHNGWLILVIGFIVSCSPRIMPPAEIRDSVRVEIRERVVHDTAYVEIPVIKEVNITKDSSSHLENDYAASDAAIVGGLLRHTLETKPQTIPMPIIRTVRDTVTLHKTGETIIKEVNVLTKWQSFSMVLGWILGGLLVLSAIILTLVKFVIKK